MKIKKCLLIRIVIIGFTLIFLQSQYSQIFANTNTPEVYAPSCILMDLDSGKILYSKNSNEKMFPASTTKVMTAILTLENKQLTDIVTISHNSIYNVPYGYSTASLYEGEQLTVEQLLHVLLIPSANDAAFALAEYVGGSVENFANMMNAKALEIGCKNTHFVNPNGIHNDNHYSTAYDLALIGKYAMQNDIFKKIVSETTYTLPSTNKYDKADRIFNTTNELIRSNSKYYYKYATGAKTGYTENAKSCIIATATKDNVNLIAVILHDEKTDTGISTRELDCKTLFEYGLNNYSIKPIISKNYIAKTITVPSATQDTKSLDLIADKDLTALIPTDCDVSNSTANIVLNDNISAPISTGDVLGTITYTVDNYSYTANLVASHDVYKFNFTKVLLEIGLILTLLFIFAFIINHINNNKKNNKIKYSKKKHHSGKHKYKHSNFYPKF